MTTDDPHSRTNPAGTPDKAPRISARSPATWPSLAERPGTVRDAEVGEGLGSLVGRWEDGDELADEVGRVVAERRILRRRSIRDLDLPG